ncbi:Inositol transporter 1 [Diplonema papillatum]|nr:Inositol transporter 1 [Diplonema papillatum]
MGNDQSSFCENDEVRVVDDEDKLRECVEECEDLEWDQTVYEGAQGRRGVVARVDEDGLVVVCFEGCSEEKYFPRKALMHTAPPATSPAASPKSPRVPPISPASLRESFRGVAATLASSFRSDEGKRLRPKLIFAMLTMAFNGFLIGYSVRAFEVTESLMYFDDGRKRFLSPFQKGAAVITCWAAACVGSAIGALSSRLGRKGTAVLGACLFIFGQFTVAGARNMSTLIVSKLFTGASFGIMSVLTPLYLSEIAPSTMRATFVSTFVLMAAVGNLFASLIALGMHEPNLDDQGWRWLLGLVIAPACIQFVPLLMLSETPLFLATRGRLEEALALARALGTAFDCIVDETHHTIDHGRTVSLDDFLAGYSTPAVVGAALFALQQLLSPTVLSSTCHVPNTSSVLLDFFGADSSEGEFTLHQQNKALAGVAAVVVLLTALVVFCINLLTRRMLLYFSFGGVGGFLGIWALGAGVSSPSLQLLGLLGYYFAYLVGLSCVPWVVGSELFVVRYREVGMGTSVFAFWLAAVVVEAVGCTLGKASHGGKQWLLSGFAVAGAVLVYMKTPETSGVSLARKNKTRGALPAAEDCSDEGHVSFLNMSGNHYVDDDVCVTLGDESTRHIVSPEAHHAATPKFGLDPDTADDIEAQTPPVSAAVAPSPLSTLPETGESLFSGLSSTDATWSAHHGAQRSKGGFRKKKKQSSHAQQQQSTRQRAGSSAVELTALPPDSHSLFEGLDLQ